MGGTVRVKLPEDLENRVCSLAIRHDKSVSEVIRVALRRMLRSEDSYIGAVTCTDETSQPL